MQLHLDQFRLKEKDFPMRALPAGPDLYLYLVYYLQGLHSHLIRLSLVRFPECLKQKMSPTLALLTGLGCLLDSGSLCLLCYLCFCLLSLHKPAVPLLCLCLPCWVSASHMCLMN